MPNGFAQKVVNSSVSAKKHSNAESVGECQPRVCLETLGTGISFLEGATLKELRRRLLTATPRNPFRVANNFLGHS
jgi:hypothetical protein